MARVAVNQHVLRWAVARSGHSQETVMKRFPFAEWLTGERQPTLRQLEDFAAFTRAPLGFLFLDKPPVEELTIPFFRTLDDQAPETGSPDLLEMVQTLRRRQEWVREYLIGQGQAPLPFVGKTPLTDDPVQVAGHIRETLGLADGWAHQCATWEDALRYLRNAMDTIGIFVVVNGIVGNNTHRPLDPNEFRGFVLVDEYAPFVFVNGADAKAAQMFTLAHELAHIFFGYSAAFDLRALHPADDQVEELCNLVAAELLVPADHLRRLWPSVRGALDPFQALARRFKVSTLVIVRRLLDLSFITRAEFFDYYNEYKARLGEKKAAQENGGDYYKNKNVRVGKRFFANVVHALHEGMITYTEAYRLTDLRGQTFRKYADMVIGGDLQS